MSHLEREDSNSINKKQVQNNKPRQNDNPNPIILLKTPQVITSLPQSSIEFQNIQEAVINQQQKQNQLKQGKLQAQHFDDQNLENRILGIMYRDKRIQGHQKEQKNDCVINSQKKATLSNEQKIQNTYKKQKNSSLLDHYFNLESSSPILCQKNQIIASEDNNNFDSKMQILNKNQQKQYPDQIQLDKDQHKQQKKEYKLSNNSNQTFNLNIRSGHDLIQQKKLPFCGAKQRIINNKKKQNNQSFIEDNTNAESQYQKQIINRNVKYNNQQMKNQYELQQMFGHINNSKNNKQYIPSQQGDQLNGYQQKKVANNQRDFDQSSKKQNRDTFQNSFIGSTSDFPFIKKCTLVEMQFDQQASPVRHNQINTENIVIFNSQNSFAQRKIRTSQERIETISSEVFSCQPKKTQKQFNVQKQSNQSCLGHLEAGNILIQKPQELGENPDIQRKDPNSRLTYEDQLQEIFDAQNNNNKQMRQSLVNLSACISDESPTDKQQSKQQEQAIQRRNKSQNYRKTNLSFHQQLNQQSAKQNPKKMIIQDKNYAMLPKINSQIQQNNKIKFRSITPQDYCQNQKSQFLEKQGFYQAKNLAQKMNFHSVHIPYPNNNIKNNNKKEFKLQKIQNHSPNFPQTMSIFSDIQNRQFQIQIINREGQQATKDLNTIKNSSIEYCDEHLDYFKNQNQSLSIEDTNFVYNVGGKYAKQQKNQDLFLNKQNFQSPL